MAEQKTEAAATYLSTTDAPELTAELTPEDIVLAETILSLVALDFPERPADLVLGLIGNKIFNESLVKYGTPDLPEFEGIPPEQFTHEFLDDIRELLIEFAVEIAFDDPQKDVFDIPDLDYLQGQAGTDKQRAAENKTRVWASDILDTVAAYHDGNKSMVRHVVSAQFLPTPSVFSLAYDWLLYFCWKWNDDHDFPKGIPAFEVVRSYLQTLPFGSYPTDFQNYFIMMIQTKFGVPNAFAYTPARIDKHTAAIIIVDIAHDVLAKISPDHPYTSLSPVDKEKYIDTFIEGLYRSLPARRSHKKQQSTEILHFVTDTLI